MILNTEQTETALHLRDTLAELLTRRGTLESAIAAVPQDAPTTEHAKANDALVSFDTNELHTVVREHRPFLGELAEQYRADIAARIETAIAPFVPESGRAEFIARSFDVVKEAAHRATLFNGPLSHNEAFSHVTSALAVLAVVLG